jgi:hypothetical protein
MKKNLLLILTVVLFSSCAKNFYSHRSVNVEKNNLITTPVVTDLNVDFSKKVNAKSDPKKTVAAAKDEAYYRAITNNPIDVLVDPIYNIEEKPTLLIFRRRSTAEVTGFAAKYANAKNVHDAVKLYNIDTTSIKNFITLTNTDNPAKGSAENAAFSKPVDAKKKSLGLLIGAIAAIMLLGGM